MSVLFLFMFLILKNCSSGTEDPPENNNLIKQNHREYADSTNYKKLTEKEFLNGSSYEIKDNDTLHYLKREQELNKASFFSRTFSWFWSNIFSFVLIVLIFYCFKRISKQDVRIKRNKKELINLLKDKADAFGQISMDSGESVKMKHNNKELEEVKERLAKLEERVCCLETGNQQAEEEDNPVEEEQNKEELIFFPAPNSNGHFYADDGSPEYKQNTHFYKFVVNVNDTNKAEFYFIYDDDTAQFAINYPDGVLRNACEIENFFKDNPATIVTQKPGIAIKQKDKWIVEMKSIVRYE